MNGNRANLTDSSPYFTHFADQERRHQQTGTSHENQQSELRQRELAFQPNGRLEIRQPFVNPTPRNDPRRKNLSDVARETKLLLPGLLATRPDVTSDSFLCSRIVLDATYCPHLQPTRVRVLAMDTIDAALSLPAGEPRPVAVLNMANASTPGGGWLHGALAQEEALC